MIDNHLKKRCKKDVEKATKKEKEDWGLSYRCKTFNDAEHIVHVSLSVNKSCNHGPPPSKEIWNWTHWLDKVCGEERCG